MAQDPGQGAASAACGGRECVVRSLSAACGVDDSEGVGFGVGINADDEAEVFCNDHLFLLVPGNESASVVYGVAGL
jgi:hypothetical protein